VNYIFHKLSSNTKHVKFQEEEEEELRVQRRTRHEWSVLSHKALPQCAQHAGSRHSNSNSIWAHGELLFKMGCKFYFFVFFENLQYAARGWIPKIKRQGAKKEVGFVHRILDFFLFTIFVFVHYSIQCHLQSDHFDLNVKSLMFFKKFYKFQQKEF
jgi:hypothetical protein